MAYFCFICERREELEKETRGRVIKIGEGNVRTSGVDQTGEAHGTKEKEDDFPARRKEDERMSGERRRIIEYRIY